MQVEPGLGARMPPSQVAHGLDGAAPGAHVHLLVTPAPPGSLLHRVGAWRCGSHRGATHLGSMMASCLGGGGGAP